VGDEQMWISAAVALLFIVGLLFSMLSSSPKADPGADV